jgi:hypothetical protein
MPVRASKKRQNREGQDFPDAIKTLFRKLPIFANMYKT